MKFKVEKRESRVKEFPAEELNIARKFGRKMFREFGSFLKAVVVFGSVAQFRESKKDIDILVILDDVTTKFSRELVSAYRIITEKIIAQVAPGRLHVQSMKFSSFWEYVRAGDPVAINILRYGIALIDTGFFDPLQVLLEQGRIRPSEEAVYTYFTMAPASVQRAKEHILTATVDLYWATIDSAHAALMKLGQIPPTPDHVADMLERAVVKKKLITKKSANTMRTMYKLFKGITHREIKDIKGKDFDKYKDMVTSFVNEMRKFIENRV